LSKKGESAVTILASFLPVKLPFADEKMFFAMTKSIRAFTWIRIFLLRYKSIYVFICIKIESNYSNSVYQGANINVRLKCIRLKQDAKYFSETITMF
jgi:hypothetical protein